MLISRRFEFDAGHRVFGHESKCAYLHGHRYVADVMFQSSELDALGRVIDFGILKESCGTWIDGQWDHALLLHPNDPIHGALMEAGEASRVRLLHDPLRGDPLNPTAENMAYILGYVLQVVIQEAQQHIDAEVVEVSLWETPNCRAIWRKK